jgi:two-component system LytT family response regulator
VKLDPSITQVSTASIVFIEILVWSSPARQVNVRRSAKTDAATANLSVSRYVYLTGLCTSVAEIEAAIAQRPEFVDNLAHFNDALADARQCASSARDHRVALAEPAALALLDSQHTCNTPTRSGLMDGAPIRTIIADDEPEGRANLRCLLMADAQIELAAECASGTALVRAIDQHEPQLLVIDIQMPGLSGLEAVQRLPPGRQPVVVFVTAHDRYAPRAFDVAAIDYVLKPFTDARFQTAIERAKQALRGRELERLRDAVAALANSAGLLGSRPGAAAEAGYLERLTVRTGKRFTIISAADVDWIEAAADYARLHVRGRRHLLRCTMQALEQRLDPRRFIRVHRSTIVNIAAITEIRHTGADEYVVVLPGGIVRELSERGRSKLARQFDVHV